jgi:hypothetical protein
LGRKPWDYPITVVIPHLGPVEALDVVLALFQLQTVIPYILVIDTGSPWEQLDALEKLRAPNVEVHYIRSHGYQHSSSPVSAALDLGFDLCRTEFLFLTHNDVFLRSRKVISWYMEFCNVQNPVIGYEMSPRELTQEWRGCVSHTATMLHVPTLREIGITWSFESYWQNLGYRPAVRHGFPDTEQPFNLWLKKAGIKPTLIGHETNFRRYVDEFVDHARSHTGLDLYAPGQDLQKQAQSAYNLAVLDARQRLERWQKEKP